MTRQTPNRLAAQRRDVIPHTPLRGVCLQLTHAAQRRLSESSHAHLSRKHADFEHPELLLLPCSTGQGMFIRSDTPAFTLLLVSKAFVFMPMKSATDVRFTTVAHDKGQVKTTANLLYETLIRALADHPEYCQEFYSLAAGEPWDSTPLSSDHSERVDVRRIMATLRCTATPSVHVAYEALNTKVCPAAWTLLRRPS
jgi:hypothetical protein